MARLEHIGIAVDEVTYVIDCFQDLLDVQPYKAETVESQHVRTHLIDANGAKLELLEALNDDSPIARFIERDGEGLHHIAFEVSDADATMERLRTAGFTILSDEPEKGADDKRIFFVRPKETHGVLVEFCESTVDSWTPRAVPRGDGSLSIFERGNPERPTLLFLHGAGGSTVLETAPLMRKLESTFHTVGVDLSGHGASSFPKDGHLRMDALVRDAIAALDAVDENAAHVFGFSLGGALALRLAQIHPARVNRLALFQTNARWPAHRTDQMLQRLDLNELRDRAPDHVARLETVHEEPERLFQRLQALIKTLPMASEPMWHTISDIAAPILIGTVDRDPLFDADVARTLQGKLPHARLAILPGQDHSLIDGPVDLLAPLIRDFLTDPEPYPSAVPPKRTRQTPA